MKSKLIEVPTIPEVTEKRSRHCQNSGCSSVSHRGVESESRTASWMQLITARRSLLLLVLVVLPSMVCAQTSKGSWSNLNGLKSGQGIEVIESSMKRHHGQFLTVTDESLSLQESGSDVSIKRQMLCACRHRRPRGVGSTP